HLARAVAEEEVARLAGVDVAAAELGGIGAAQPALPGELVLREEHLVAARADAVDALGGGGFCRRDGAEEGRARLEARLGAWIGDVGARTAVAGLAADAQLDRLLGAEAGAGSADGELEQLGERAPVMLAAIAEQGQLLVEGAAQGGLVGDGEAEA